MRKSPPTTLCRACSGARTAAFCPHCDQACSKFSCAKCRISARKEWKGSGPGSGQ